MTHHASTSTRLLALAVLPLALAACTQSPSPAPQQPQAAEPALQPTRDVQPVTPPPVEPVAIGTGITDTGIDLATVMDRYPDASLPAPVDDAASSTTPADATQSTTTTPTTEAPATSPTAIAAAGDATLPKDSPLRAQVLLDRAFFSTGEIDGVAGSNQMRALRAYQKANGLPESGKLDPATWDKLNADTAPILVEYVITQADIDGPYKAIPADTMAKSKMDALPFSSIEEMLGEKFHASPALLKKLNPNADFKTAGTKLTVPNVAEINALPAPDKIIVSKSLAELQLVDAAGKVLARFPVTTGSAQFPLPIGEWKINGVARNPVWHFDPKLIAGTKKTDTKAKIPPGPNNPVGVAWIDLSKEHYGIHGTPEPSKIGKTESNGCIRMTNWTVAALAKVVKPGMTASLQP